MDDKDAAVRPEAGSSDEPAPRTPSQPATGMSQDASAVRPRHFGGFDGLRAIAAVSVVLVHTAFDSGFTFTSSLGAYTSRLEIGVSIFFLISGFLLYRPFAVSHLSGRSAPNTRRFWERRLLRIVPAYWLALTLLTYVFHLVKMGPGFANVVVHYFFMQIYFNWSFSYGISQAWSLCTEMSFYLVLPAFAALVVARRKGSSNQLVRELIAVAAVYFLSCWFRWWYTNQSFWTASHGHLQPVCYPHCTSHVPGWLVTNLWLPAQMDLFALGMLLAVLSAWWTEHDSEPKWLSARWMPWVSWLGAVLAFWAVSHLGIPTQFELLPLRTTSMEQHGLYGIFALLLLLPAVFGPEDRSLIRRFLRCWPMASLGVVSYGIYLWHIGALDQFMSWTGYVLFEVPFWILSLGTLALSIVVASISYFALEKPVLRLKDRLGWWNRPIGPTAEAEAEVLAK